MISWLLSPPMSVVQNPAWRIPCFSQIRSVLVLEPRDSSAGLRPGHASGRSAIRRSWALQPSNLVDGYQPATVCSHRSGPQTTVVSTAMFPCVARE